MKSALWGLNALLLLLAAIGLALNRRRERWLFAVPIPYLAGIYLPFHSVETRYSVAAVPFLLLFAIDGLAALWRRSANDADADCDNMAR